MSEEALLRSIDRLQESAVFWADVASNLDRRGNTLAADAARDKMRERLASLEARLAELEEVAE